MNTYRTRVSEISDGSDAPAGWVRVEMPQLGPEAESDWIEWPSLSIGGGFGVWLPPMVGTRVRVGFDDTDEGQDDPSPSTDLKRAVLKLPSDWALSLQVGEVSLEISDGKILLGGDVGWVARADLIVAQINTLISTLNTHVHVAPVVGATGPSTSPATPIQETDIASTKARTA